MRLIAENLGGERGGLPVFSAVSFVLDEGRALTVTGPNGSGKSTLLRVLAGLLPTAAGAVRLEGDAAYPTPASACHYLGDRNGMKPPLTVAENLGFWHDFLGASSLGIADALDRVDLGDLGHLPYGVMSTGQRRRVAIARMLVSHRPIWLLDEPTSGLDAASEARFAGIMREHLEDGGMIVAATHLPLGLTGAAELRMGVVG